MSARVNHTVKLKMYIATCITNFSNFIFWYDNLIFTYVRTYVWSIGSYRYYTRNLGVLSISLWVHNPHRDVVVITPQYISIRQSLYHKNVFIFMPKKLIGSRILFSYSITTMWGLFIFLKKSLLKPNSFSISLICR